MGTVPGIISSIELCLSEDINESMRKGLDAIGFAGLDFWEKMAVLSLARQFKAKGLEPYRLCDDEDNVNEGRLACSAEGRTVSISRRLSGCTDRKIGFV